VANREPPAAGKRILLTIFGSLGDLHPYLAIALGLQARGHEAIVATSPAYEPTVTALGLGFRPLRPDLPDPARMPAEMRRAMDERRGTEVVLRRWVLPNLRGAFADLLAAADGADLLVSHLLTFATPLVAELCGLPWVSTVLQPATFFSVYDPPHFPQTAPFVRMPLLGPWFWRSYRRLTERITGRWLAPYHDLRAELGLPRATASPIITGHSPWLVLALFSRLLGPPQPDWPPRTVVTGFPYFVPPGPPTLPDGLAEFLAAGSPPIVFTLGSAAVHDPGRFFAASAEAAARVGRRAVLVGAAVGRPEGRLADDLFVTGFAPYASVFPLAAAIVHQGGIGTTAEALRAGKPTIVVPFAHDQPDNARRLARLGVSRTVPRGHYDADRAARELRRVLGDRECGARAAQVAAHVRVEDGVARACDALEATL
jgi:UDP:flavonoid glycosyltransferase YjiC (YdhE family)